MRIKLRDIAERANVSQATVSRVLNNHPSVDPRTRASVHTVLTQLGYPVPGESIEQQNGKAKYIFVATRGVESRPLPDESDNDKKNPYFDDFAPLVIDGIETVARRLGMHMRIERLRLEEPGPAELARLRQADGVVVVGGILGRGSIIDELEKIGKPFVVAGGHLGDREINCVLGDYLRSANLAVKTLAQLGHRRIALVNGPPTTTTSQDKLAGYRLGIAEYGLGLDEKLIVAAGDFDPHSGYRVTQELLSRTRRFTAILYASDLLAVGGLKMLKEAGLAVPNDISVVGFYNGAMAQFTDPPLTTVHLDRQRLGEIATQRLHALMEQHDSEKLRIVVPMHFITRGSTRSIED